MGVNPFTSRRHDYLGLLPDSPVVTGYPTRNETDMVAPLSIPWRTLQTPKARAVDRSSCGRPVRVGDSLLQTLSPPKCQRILNPSSPEFSRGRKPLFWKPGVQQMAQTASFAVRITRSHTDNLMTGCPAEWPWTTCSPARVRLFLRVSCRSPTAPAPLAALLLEDRTWIGPG